MNNLVIFVKYLIFLILLIPMVPYLIYKGRKIRKNVPNLPEAKNKEGNGHVDKKILFIGESTVAGVGVQDHKDGIAGRTCYHLENNFDRLVDWKVLARSGYRSREAIQRLLPKLPSKRPEAVVIGMGGNDTFKLTSPFRFRSEITMITKQIQGQYPNVPVVILSLPPISLFPAFQVAVAIWLGMLVKLHSKAIKTIHNPQLHRYVMPSLIEKEDWILLTGDHLDELFSDGVHPSGRTYDIWAQLIASYLNKHILEPKN